MTLFQHETQKPLSWHYSNPTLVAFAAFPPDRNSVCISVYCICFFEMTQFHELSTLELYCKPLCPKKASSQNRDRRNSEAFCGRKAARLGYGESFISVNRRLRFDSYQIALLKAWPLKRWSNGIGCQLLHDWYINTLAHLLTTVYMRIYIHIYIYIYILLTACQGSTIEKKLQKVN